MKTPRTKPSLLFRLVVPVTVVFILTILSLIASIFGDPAAPIAKWLDAHGNALLFWEFVAIIVIGIAAMTFDRFRTLRGKDEEPFEANGEPEATSSSTTSEPAAE